MAVPSSATPPYVRRRKRRASAYPFFGAPAPPGRPAGSGPPGALRGAQAEIELFRTALLAAEPPFAVLHVHGPGGVGKTTLLREYARVAAECRAAGRARSTAAMWNRPRRDS